MYDKAFWIKYAFRLAHMASVIFLGGRVLLTYLYPCEGETLTKGMKIAFALSGAVLIVSGFVNMFILNCKDKLKEHYKLWVSLVHIKLLTTILFLTPIFDWITRPIDGFPKVAFQFWFVMTLIVVSPFMRFHREMWTEKNRQKFQQVD